MKIRIDIQDNDDVSAIEEILAIVAHQKTVDKPWAYEWYIDADSITDAAQILWDMGFSVALHKAWDLNGKTYPVSITVTKDFDNVEFL